MNRILIVAVATGAVLGTAAAARATTLTTATQTVTFGPALTEFANASKPLALFNSALGTLDSVTIGGTYGFNSTLSITNSGSTSSTGAARTESAAAFGSDNSGVNTVIQNLLDTNGSTDVGGTVLNPAAVDILGNKSPTYNLSPGASTSTTSNANKLTIAAVTDTLASDLQAFQAAGGGVFNALFNTATATVLSNTGGNTSATESTTATGTVNLYYTYDTRSTPPPAPVPEPTSIALLGAGLLGVGLFRQSRK